jgi:tRNA 2-selenouridine synthase
VPEILPIDEFLARAAKTPVVDVRTPAEFAQGHIPGAVNVPLFSDEERAEVGTAYKQRSRREAVKIGVGHVGPRMNELADRIFGLADPAGGEVLMHCWRGGMRSGGVAWLMEAFGCRVATLKGGYKAFRRWVLESFEIEREIRVVSGLTGTGKTEILLELEKLGEQVIDLEGLARHKGSAFGALGEAPPPTQPQFENQLAVLWRATDPQRPVWLEDESRMIGRAVLPDALWEQKRAGFYEVVELPDEERVQHLCKVYAGFPAEELIPRVEAIRRRLGGAEATRAIDALQSGDFAEACRHILPYYDRTYGKCLSEALPGRVRHFPFPRLDPPAIAESLAKSVPRPG